MEKTSNMPATSLITHKFLRPRNALGFLEPDLTENVRKKTFTCESAGKVLLILNLIWSQYRMLKSV